MQNTNQDPAAKQKKGPKSRVRSGGKGELGPRRGERGPGRGAQRGKRWKEDEGGGGREGDPTASRCRRGREGGDGGKRAWPAQLLQMTGVTHMK